MNEFRARLRGEPVELNILAGKRPRRTAGDYRLDTVVIRRTEKRPDSRTGTRHRLSEESVGIAGQGSGHVVTLINLSDGGAMIEGECEASLHDPVDLRLSDAHQLRCKVKWLKGRRTGLEFLPGTQVGCTPKELDSMVMDVIARTYPNLKVAEAEPAVQIATSCANDDLRDDQRHGLVWSATLHHDFESTTVRLRNISASGALIQSDGSLPVGATPLLEVGKFPPLNCEVVWAFGDQAGLRFSENFDVSILRNTAPVLSLPATLGKERSGELVTLDQLSGSELQTYLEGFLKR